MGVTSSKVSGPLGASKVRCITAAGTMRLSQSSFGAGVPDRSAARSAVRTAGPRTRVTRRTADPIAADGNSAADHCSPKLARSDMAGAVISRARSGASTNTPVSALSGST